MLSILITTYNNANTITQCLESIYKTRGSLDVEIIVFDNNSLDQTTSIVSDNFPQVRLTKNRENIGFARSTNQCLAEAKGDQILLLNPDIVLHPTTLRQLTGTLAKRGPAIVGGKNIYPNKKVLPSFGDFPTKWTLFTHLTRIEAILPDGVTYHYNLWNRDKFKQTLRVDWTHGGLMLFPKEIIDKIGNFDESFFIYMEDIDFCLRAAKAKIPTYVNPNAVVTHFHQVSVGTLPGRAIRARLESIHYYARKNFSDFQYMRTIMKTYIYFKMIEGNLLALFGYDVKDELKELEEALSMIRNTPVGQIGE